MRKGVCCREILSNVRLDIDDLELLIGRIQPGWTPFMPAEIKAAETYLEQYPPAPGQTGHCEPDYQPVFTIGLDGLLERIAERSRKAGTDEERQACESFRMAIEGLSVLIRHAAEVVEAAMPSAPETRRHELKAIAASCRRIAHQPPDGLRDAVQLMYFVFFGIMHGDGVYLVVPGHIDRTLRAFYQADMQSGRLNRDEALALLESLYLLINEYIPDGLAMSVMVGGRDAQGFDVTDDLSYLALEALRRTNLVYPTVGVCWHPGTPEALTDLAVDLISQGYTTPAFFGDDVVQKGLQALGLPADESCNYINSTCVEITPVGSSNVWVASPYFSICRLLLDEIAAQTTSGAPAPAFDVFFEAYQQRLAERIALAVTEQNSYREARRQWGGKPLQSVFTRDCIERGRDIDNGGARYNWVECSFVGLANLADSLYVIREEIFHKNQIRWTDLKKVLDSNFEGHESIRRRFLEGYPKYGLDHPEVDQLFGRIVSFLQRSCARHKIKPDGSPLVPGAFCWIMHAALGRECGATPDGRLAGFPFADGCGPAQGREKKGPTAAILSTTSWNHAPMIGGLAFNMKFNRSLCSSPDGVQRLKDLILTFLRRGGFETQINVVDNEMLRRAMQNPDAYRDLVVRIGGYTDYFVRLSPQMRSEVLARTEFANV